MKISAMISCNSLEEFNGELKIASNDGWKVKKMKRLSGKIYWAWMIKTLNPYEVKREERIYGYN